MKTQRIILLGLGLAWSALAVGAPVQTNSEAQQRALDVLRQTMDAMQNKPAPPKRAVTPPRHEPTFADVEQLYLQGKITAREFQKYLEDHKLEPGKVANQAPPTSPGGTSRKEPPAQPGKGEAASDTNPAPSTDQSSLSDLEKKMDELLRLKAARESTVATNSGSTTATNAATAATPKTKRERLDALLKLYIEGKISDPDYKDKRAKIISEPD